MLGCLGCRGSAFGKGRGWGGGGEAMGEPIRDREPARTTGTYPTGVQSAIPGGLALSMKLLSARRGHGHTQHVPCRIASNTLGLQVYK